MPGKRRPHRSPARLKLFPAKRHALTWTGEHLHLAVSDPLRAMRGGQGCQVYRAYHAELVGERRRRSSRQPRATSGYDELHISPSRVN